MVKEKRHREIPSLEKGDMVIREDRLIGDKLLKEIDINKAAIVVDTPADGYLLEIKQEVALIYPNIEISVIGPGDIAALSALHDGKKQRLIIAPYDRCLKNSTVLLDRTHVVFVNIRKASDKKIIIAEGKKKKYCFYFVSNVYKLENMEEIERLGFGRVLPIKKGFGLARSVQAFARTHEIIFAGAPHLKQNAFVIALERDVSVPCLILVQTEKEIEEVQESIDRIKSLLGKGTADIFQYLCKKKWLLVTTYSNLLKIIRKDMFKAVRDLTKCVVAYNATDNTINVLAMHQVAQNVFSVVTTKDRGMSKKITELLPKYGILLKKHAELMKASFQDMQEKKNLPCAAADS